MPTHPANNINSFVQNQKEKERICTTFTRASITALNKYKANKGFLNEQDTIRFIVNAVLIKEGLLPQQQ